MEAIQRGADILIATPGRLWDLMGQKVLDISKVECFVLDEADRMLDMGFIGDVKRIAAHIPKKRQSLLFSATMPDEKPEKRAILQYILREKDIPQTLVFSRTKDGADRIARDLNRAGISARSLHGDKSQGARQAALREFKEYKIAVLVATDIAARGLDISELPLVINFDLPNIPETYTWQTQTTKISKTTCINWCIGIALPAPSTGQPETRGKT